MFGLTKALIYFFFFITSFFSICFALVIFFADNTVYAAFSLVGLFFCSFVILLVLKAEFLALIYLMLYIGAVAVIFLFAVMFIDLRLEDTWVDLTYIKNYGVSLVAFFKLLAALQLIANSVESILFPNAFHPSDFYLQVSFASKFAHLFTDILCIANLLYNHYLLHLVLLSLILWGVMLGSVSICTSYKK